MQILGHWRAARQPASVSARTTQRAVVDLAIVVAFVWAAALFIHRFDVPGALDQWDALNGHWAIDEVTMVSLCVAVALGVFSWRRWRESQLTIARHEATLEQLRATEGEIASRDQLIRSVSHELRTPLTAVLGYAELLGDEELHPQERESMIDTIIREGHDLANIVEDLLTRAQAESETLTVVEVPLHPAAQLSQVLEAWAQSGEMEIAVDVEHDVRAVGDPARVRQIIRNLITNAMRYGARPIEVRIRRDKAGHAVLEVADHGEGIPDTDRDQIFDPYHRIVTSASTPGGLGLGLAISRQLASMMRGELTYRRELDKSIFSLSLPLLQPPPESPPSA